MARSGQILENPHSGERFTFLETAADTVGERLLFELEVQPDGRVPGGHVHPKQQERFDVLGGVLKFRKGLRSVVAGPGDTVIVPPNTYHRFVNVGSKPAKVRVEVRPALRMEQVFETVVALAYESRTRASGMPKPLDLAVFMHKFQDEVAAPIAPRLILALVAPLAWLGARHGPSLPYRITDHPSSPAPAPARPREAKRPGSRPQPSGRPQGRGVRASRSSL